MQENIRTYYNTQDSLAEAIKGHMDLYFGGSLTEEELKLTLKKLITANQEVLKSSDPEQFPPRVKNRLAKRRLGVIKKMMLEDDAV